jgi:hypothetical protein
MTKTLNDVIDEARAADLSAAATLLRFAADVLTMDSEGQSSWVVLHAIDDAEKNLRMAVSDGDDMNTVDSRLSALRLRLGVCGVRDIIQAERMAVDTVDDKCFERAQAQACVMLEAAAKKCGWLAWQAQEGYRLACQAEDAG